MSDEPRALNSQALTPCRRPAPRPAFCDCPAQTGPPGAARLRDHYRPASFPDRADHDCAGRARLAHSPRAHAAATDLRCNVEAGRGSIRILAVHHRHRLGYPGRRPAGGAPVHHGVPLSVGIRSLGDARHGQTRARSAGGHPACGLRRVGPGGNRSLRRTRAGAAVDSLAKSASRSFKSTSRLDSASWPPASCWPS